MARGKPKFATIRDSKDTPLVKLLLSQTAKLELSMREIADKVGWKHTSVVANILKGSMAVPIDKVKALSECLEIDPVTMLKLSRPNEFDVIRSIFRSYPTTSNEQTLIDLWRDACGGQDTVPETPNELNTLKELAKQVSERRARELRPSFERLDERRVKRGHEPKWVKEFEDSIQ